MSVLGDLLIVVGSGLMAIAGLGLVRLRTTYARLHAAGKASPFGFLTVAAGAALSSDAVDAARLAVAGVALVITMPIGVHLLFRAVHRTSPPLRIDDLAPAERAAAREAERRADG